MSYHIWSVLYLILWTNAHNSRITKLKGCRAGRIYVCANIELQAHWNKYIHAWHNVHYFCLPAWHLVLLQRRRKRESSWCRRIAHLENEAAALSACMRGLLSHATSVKSAFCACKLKHWSRDQLHGSAMASYMRMLLSPSTDVILERFLQKIACHDNNFLKLAVYPLALTNRYVELSVKRVHKICTIPDKLW